MAGRPIVGKLIETRMPADLIARIDESKGVGETRAQCIRRLIEAGLTIHTQPKET